ncbi:BZ3500_MvSof-1268-A1-R1_Chr2-2g05144 [Microbotryum saponariae]|uniref:BZ3500_MvSof-1268-A1-R1_Chr2-2g05144 protein n=1 Tax=Microbotryum saponariae TaxID=289078 RepID=A0A2X0K8U8_9BASI|nr:BZ3500_MvSof-1268-A1-R1_Chr2-2g05144 [Microbotryum saponariae]SDA00971.1 BZ3501_MvSof-1269-A2-R1_Chr2-2g04818 [Microbotryum saponariae]
MTSKIRHEWYQTTTEIVLSVFIRNVNSEQLKVDLQPRSVSLSIPLATGSDVVFDLDPLAHEIDAQASSVRVLTPKIELKLIKKEPGIKWDKIEGDDDHATTTMGAPVESTPTHSYPSSSKKKITNWDAFVKTAEEEESAQAHQEGAKKDPNAGGDKALNEMFQKLYEGATDDQRRAMIKSYQESNGTALSTDWSDVSKRTVETKPPDSMIAKKWGQ